MTNLGVKYDDSRFLEIIGGFGGLTRLFFIISGFSICCGYYEKFKSGSITPVNFYKKRYGRILPFFACLCMLDFVLTHTKYSFYELFANLTLLFGFIPYHEIEQIGVGWFLGVIFSFYILFPYFVFCLDNRRSGVVSLLLSICFASIISLYSFSQKSPIPCTEYLGKNILLFAPFFLCGGYIYLWRNNLTNIVSSNREIATIIIIAVIVLYYGPLDFGFVFNESITTINEGVPYFRELKMLVFFSCLLVYAIGTHGIVLNNRMVKYLSSISMEIYLCHMVCFRVIEKLGLTRHFSNEMMKYAITSILVIVMAVVFSHVMKFYFLPTLDKLCMKVTRRLNGEEYV